MTADRFPHLLSPLTIGRVTVRNRAFSSAHGTGFAVNGLLSERHIEYHRARARGGIGLIVIEATAIDDAPISAGVSAANLHNTSDAVLPLYRRIADAVHAEGAKIFCLLSHSGRNTVMGPQGQPPMAPSAIPMDRTRDIPHELEREEIAAIVAAFAAAARRCRDGGLDGVELSFTHGNLVQQFLSPASNKRSDDYGGSADNRLRLAREVLQAVRAAIGPDFTFGIRYSAAELIADGYRLEDGVRFAQRMVDWGALDYVDVSAGTNSSMWSRSIHYPTISSPPRPLVHLAKAVRDAVKVPVFCIGKLADPAEAEAIVAAGEADMVGMTRAHIAEPHIVRLLTEGREAEIRPCVGATYCLDRIYEGNDALCVHNPATGREAMMPHRVAPTEGKPRKVVVVGAGPGGLEAARVAAARGHRVALFEAAAQPGGQILLACRLARRKELIGIVDWRMQRLEAAGVRPRFSVYAGEADVLAEAPDVVILATGGVPNTAVLAAGNDLVVSTWDILSGTVAPAARVLVFDDNGGHQAMQTAELLAEAGSTVEIVSPERYFAPEMGGMNHTLYAAAFHRRGVRITINARLLSVRREGNALWAEVGSDHGPERFFRVVDQVVVEHGTLPPTELYDVLRPLSRNLGEVDHAALLAGRRQEVVRNPAGQFQLFRIGDAVASRNIHAAIYDALRLVKDL